jgi:hypothetical protein
MTFSVLFESTNIITPNDIIILESESRNKDGSERVVFKTKLQTANEVNGNKRYYSREICNRIIEGLKPIAKSRSLFQEVDHPFLNSSDVNVQKKRAVTVELRNCGSLVRDIYMEGSDIVGEIQTLSGFQGPSLRDLIVKDKANIGFSLRMLGSVKPHPNMEGVGLITDPIKPITYDIVTNPSHKSARVLSFIPESCNNFIDDECSNLITENEILTLENAHLPISSKQIVDEYLMNILKEEFSSIKSFRFEF